MARSKQKEENGEDLDDMDYSPDETVEIHGGYSTNGRPAELVRKKNGKSISLAPEIANMSTGKRHHEESDEEIDDEDDVLRSMARRRKNDKGETRLVCKQCGVVRARNCDMKKHIDSHIRKHKCHIEDCPYFDKGFPTSKERDRHVNDKHSSAPAMYQCHFKPCTYSSKRESNCKQHMEKAHNWTYVRSKNNGRKKAQSSVTAPSPSSSAQSPTSPHSPFAATPASSNMQIGTPQSTHEIMQSPVQMTYDYGRRDSGVTNFTYDSNLSGPYHPSIDSTVSMEPFTFNTPLFPTNDFSALNFDSNLLAMTNFQQTTPSPNSVPALTFDNGAQMDPQDILHLSPEAQQLTLPINEPMMMTDEGFHEGMFNADFQLYADNIFCGAPQDPGLMGFNPTLTDQFEFSVFGGTDPTFQS